MKRKRATGQEAPAEDLRIDLEDAHSFLMLLGQGDRDFTFQTFQDAKGSKDPSLNRVLHGTLETHAEQLSALNAEGAGIFVMVNRGDGEGRSAKNVIQVRANFVDLDGAPLEPVIASEAHPSIIVASSPGRWQAYWLVSDERLEDFSPTQVALSKRFNSDPSVSDLPRVMRVPGFLHRKAIPFLSHIVFPKRSQ